MAIVKDLTITVKGGTAKLDKDVHLYLGDGKVTLLITVVEPTTKFGTFRTIDSNIVEEQGTVYAKVCVLKPNNVLVYSNRCSIIDNKIKFDIKKEFIDEIREEGKHLLQIHLYDSMSADANRLTIPPVFITLHHPICDGDCENINELNAKVDDAKVGVNTVAHSVLTFSTFDSDGNYNKHNWQTGQMITEPLLNKIEDAIYINRNDINENKSNITSIWDKINSGINIKPATKTDLGVIKVGNSLMIDTDGTLNIYLAYLQSEILNMLLKENTDLLTANKTIIGAINELKTMLDELKGQSTKSYFDESFNNTTGELTFVGHNSEVTYDDSLGALNFIGGTVNYNSETGELVII